MTRHRKLTLRPDQIDTLGTVLAWLLDYHDARLSDGSTSNRPADKLDKLALIVSKNRLEEIAADLKRATA